MKDKYWEGFADGVEFANRLWADSTVDELTLRSLLEEHVTRIKERIK